MPTLVLWTLTGCLDFSRGEPVDLPDSFPVDASPTSDPALVAAVTPEAQALLETLSWPGIAVALADDGDLVMAVAVGWADVEAGRPLEHTTPMSLASVSKTFVGVAALQAVDAGRVELSAPVGDWLGYPVTHPRQGVAPTLRHLLTHHGAVSDSGEYGATYVEGDPTIGLEDFCEGYLREGGTYYRRGNWARHDVGSAFEYSNVGMACAAAALGAAADRSFADLVQRDVLEPLGLSDSGYFLAGLSSEPATPYSPADGAVRRWPQYGFATYPDGMMRMSARDVGRYLAMLAGGGVVDPGTPDEVRLVEADTLLEGLTVDPTLGTDADGQALVFAMSRLDDDELIGHSGGDYGTTAGLWFDPATGDGFAFVANGDPRGVDELSDFSRKLLAEVR